MLLPGMHWVLAELCSWDVFCFYSDASRLPKAAATLLLDKQCYSSHVGVVSSKESLGVDSSPAQSRCWCLLNQSLPAGFDSSRFWTVFSFWIVKPSSPSLHICCFCSVVLAGAVPTEQHSLLSVLSLLAAPLPCVPVSLPFMSAAFFPSPLFRSIVLLISFFPSWY